MEKNCRSAKSNLRGGRGGLEGGEGGEGKGREVSWWQSED